MADEKRQESGGRSLFVRVAALILALLVVFGAVSVALLADSKYLDRVRRWLIYGDSTEENLYTFAADSRNRYGQSGEYLVVLSQNTIQFLENDGTAYLSKQVQLSQPTLSVGGNLAAAYDVGGQNLYLFSRDGERLHLTLEEGCGFISARLNESGYLAVVYEGGGYKGIVDIYNARQEKVFTYNSSSRFLIDAAVSRSGAAAAVVALGEEAGSFCSEVIFYPLDQQEPYARTPLTGHLTMDLGVTGGVLASVSQGDVSFVDSEGKLTGVFSYNNLYLRDYSFGGEGYLSLLLNRYRSGSIGSLMTVNTDGTVIAAKDITEEVLDISASGNYVAVLYGDALIIYTKELEEYARLSNTGYASHVLMQSDGSALIIGGNTAWRYLP